MSAPRTAAFSIIVAYERIRLSVAGVLGALGEPAWPGVLRHRREGHRRDRRGRVATCGLGGAGFTGRGADVPGSTEKSGVSRSRRARVFRVRGTLPRRFWRFAALSASSLPYCVFPLAK